MISLSVIIVNYKSLDLLQNCLQSVYAHTRSLCFEVIVVDNDSKDGSEQLLKDRFSQVRFIQMGYNAGFARANNAGMRQALGNTVLLLNPDTVVENDAITACFNLLTASPYVAAGVQLINQDQSPQISGNFIMLGGLNNLLPLPYTGNFLKKLGELTGVAKPHVAEASGQVEVAWVNGAFLMVKMKAVEKAGYMDEDFFLYAEEAEWCSRLRKHGRLCIFGSLKVLHIQGETANQVFGSTGKGYYGLYDRKGLQHMVSNFVRIRKEFGAGWFLFHLMAYLAEIPIFLLGFLASRLIRGPRSAYSFSQFSGYCRNTLSLTAMSWTIIKNKPHFYKVL